MLKAGSMEVACSHHFLGPGALNQKSISYWWGTEPGIGGCWARDRGPWARDGRWPQGREGEGFTGGIWGLPLWVPAGPNSHRIPSSLAPRDSGNSLLVQGGLPLQGPGKNWSWSKWERWGQRTAGTLGNLLVVPNASPSRLFQWANWGVCVGEVGNERKPGAAKHWRVGCHCPWLWRKPLGWDFEALFMGLHTPRGMHMLSFVFSFINYPSRYFGTCKLSASPGLESKFWSWR